MNEQRGHSGDRVVTEAGSTRTSRGHSGDLVVTEARPGPEGAGEEPQAETAGPGGHFPDDPALQELYKMSYFFSIDSSFFQTQGQPREMCLWVLAFVGHLPIPRPPGG